MTYLALPRPPGFKPRHARKESNLGRLLASGVAAAVVVGLSSLHPWRADTATANEVDPAVTVTGEVSGFSCKPATKYGHPAGTAWNLTFTISNPSTAKAIYHLHWSLLDSRRSAIATGTATVTGIEPNTRVKKTGVFTVDTGETTASSQFALGEKMTCKLGAVQRAISG